jgi:Tat protein secretion system quality control protein TatD with DNase activity
MAMAEDTKQNLRFMLATAPANSQRTVEDLENLYQWVVGKEKTIVAVSETGVIKS